MYDVAFYEAFKEEEAAIRKYLPLDIRARFTSKTIQEAKDRQPEAGLISIRTQSRVPLRWAAQINGLLSRSQGYDHLAAFLEKAKTKVPCGYLKNYCARAVAEHAVMVMMVLLRRLKRQISNFDTFQRDYLTGLECFHRRALIVGVGQVGTEIVDITRGLRMMVRGVDIFPKVKGLEYVSLKEGISWADIVFCALPLTRRTQSLFNYHSLKKAKPGLVFINISRGEISLIKDLKRLLEEGTLGAISLDVYENEDLLADYLRGKNKKANKVIRHTLELKNHENVLLTPHNAFNTYEAVEHKASQSVEAIVNFLAKGRFPNSIKG